MQFSKPSFVDGAGEARAINKTGMHPLVKHPTSNNKHCAQQPTGD